MNPERDRLPDPALLNRRIREALNFGHQTSKNATSAMNTNPSSEPTAAPTPSPSPQQDNFSVPAASAAEAEEKRGKGEEGQEAGASTPSAPLPLCPSATQLHPFACPIARTFMEDRHGRLQDTPDEAAQNRWLERFGENIDLLDELFQGKLGAYPEYPGPRQP